METLTEETVKLHSEDFSFFCRACLNRSSLISLEDEPWLLCILKGILDIANIPINLENNLPTKICDKCLQKLEQISAFICLIRFSENTLRQALINKESLEKEKHGVVEGAEDKSDDFGCNSKKSTENPEFEKNVLKGNTEISDKDNDETIPESEPHTMGSELKTKVEQVDEYWDSPEFVSCSEEIIQSNELSSHSIQSVCKVEDDIEITKSEIEPEHENCKNAIERKSKGCNSIAGSSLTPSDGKFQSHLCSKKFPSENTLKQHSENSMKENWDAQKQEHRDIFSTNCSYERNLEMRKCEFCKETFVDVNIWKTHMELHSEEMLLSEREFVKINVETKSVPIKCDASSETSCENTEESQHPHEKKFIAPSKLKTHMAVHTGEKIKCEICSQMFSSSSNLRKHMKIIHSGIRYPCDICEKSFTEKCKLKHHLSTHHEPPQEFDVETKMDSDIFIKENDVEAIKMENIS
ncbi:hypothetical protein JTB14_005411 [Gonioctena quinquepunctata]|nr:hypothetical protein JTB14_005411 [Gonioctena quinquepunctata]